MKRSEINFLVRSAQQCFERHHWALPPHPRWDVTDFGLGEWERFGLVLVNLAEEPEYCEKLMYARRGMTTPSHTHKKKKEDIICRSGRLAIRVWSGVPEDGQPPVLLPIDGVKREVASGSHVELAPGSRVTLVPGVYHEFWSVSDECIIGEVSTANDDLHDNFFVNPDIGRYPGVEEDEAPVVTLLSDRQP